MPRPIEFVNASWRVRAWSGARLGFALLGPYTLVILLVLLIGGPELTSGKNGGTTRVDLLAVTYPLGASLAGASLGLLAPVCRWLVLALLAGIVSFAWLAAGISVTMDHGYEHWGAIHTVMVILSSVIFGSLMGIRVWRAMNTTEPRGVSGDKRRVRAT